MTLPKRGLKDGYQGAITAKKTPRSAFHLATGGQHVPTGAIAPITSPSATTQYKTVQLLM